MLTKPLTHPVLSGTASADRTTQPISVRAAALSVYVLIILGALIMLLPFVWMIGTSLKTEGTIFNAPLDLFPRMPTINAYFDVWQRIPFARFFANSIIFAGGVTLLSLLFDSMTAFALARLQFRGRELVFWIVLITLMVPFQITLIPLFVTVFQLGWINTFAGLIIPRATNAFGILCCGNSLSRC